MESQPLPHTGYALNKYLLNKIYFVQPINVLS